MFQAYRTVLTLPGSLAFSLAGFVARMPISMVGLGLVLFISATSGSYGLAGSVTAVSVLASAAIAPLQSRLVDRFGQGRVVPLVLVTYTVTLSVLVVSIQLGWPTPLPHLFAALAGASSPQVGSFVRARWSHLLSGKPELHTAYSVEAFLDEAIFIVGPVLATFLATGLHPAAGVVAAIVIGLVGGVLFTIQRRTEPPIPDASAASAPKAKLGWPVLGPLMVVCAGLGSLFGSAEVVVVAFATEQGRRPLAGTLLAIWAFGSLLAAVIVGAVKFKQSPHVRLRIGAIALALAMLPTLFVSNLVILGIVLFVAGFAISPTLVSTMSVAQATVPASRLTEGMSWTITGIAAGVAVGAGVVGRVIDVYGAQAGFAVPVISAALAAALAFFVRRRYAETEAESEQVS